MDGSKPRRVLIIEDEPEIRLVLALSLQHTAGFDTIEANDGYEGIAKAKEHLPDLIILDAIMPGLDGYATCRLIKQDESLKHIPVIFLTAKTDSREVGKAMRAGASACLAKPFDPLRIADQIENITQLGCAK